MNAFPLAGLLARGTQSIALLSALAVRASNLTLLLTRRARASFVALCVADVTTAQRAVAGSLTRSMIARQRRKPPT